MAFVIALLVLESILLILTLPIKVDVLGHASLLFESAEIDISLFSLRVMAIRVRMKDDKFTLSFNGKVKDKTFDKDKNNSEAVKEGENKTNSSAFKKKDKSLSPVTILKLFEMMKREKVFEFWNLSLLFAGYEAKNTSMIMAFIYAAILPRLKMKVYTAKRENTFEFDGKIKIKINLLQILTLISYKMKLSEHRESRVV